MLFEGTAYRIDNIVCVQIYSSTILTLFDTVLITITTMTSHFTAIVLM
jgi:hypothetical protein